MSTSANQSEDRVKQATPSSINAKIENNTWNNVSQYRNKSNAEITERIIRLTRNGILKDI